MNAARKLTAPLSAPAADRAAAVAAGGPVAAMQQALASALAESRQVPACPLPVSGLAERMIAATSRLAGPVLLLGAAAALIRAVY